MAKTEIPTPTLPAVTLATQLAAALAARSNECHGLGHVPDSTIAEFTGSGLYRCLLPVACGGGAADWPTRVEIAHALGAGDASQAWALTNFCDSAQVVAGFGPDAQDEVWSKGHTALIARTLGAPQRLESIHGMITATGTWPNVPGLGAAAWILAEGYLESETGRRHLHFLIPKSEARLSNDWRVSGLVGAGACGFALENVRIPAHRTLEHSQYLDGSGPGTSVNRETAFRFPREGAWLMLAAVAAGTAAGMLAEFLALARDPAKRGRRVENNFVTGLRIAESRAEIDAARLTLLEAAQATTDLLTAGMAVGQERRALNGLKSGYATLLAARAADRVYVAAGAKAIHLANVLQRRLLDVHAIGAQDIFSWNQTGAVYGAYCLALPSTNPTAKAPK